MPRVRLLVLLALTLVVLAACAPGANPAVGTAPGDATPAGFWLGLWQGLIAPITFVISLFNDGVNIYEVHNTGGWYNFGFVLGLGMFVGGGSSGARRSR